jgi:hypothetical protein
LIGDEQLRARFGLAAHAAVQRFAPDHVLDRWEREFALLER